MKNNLNAAQSCRMPLIFSCIVEYGYLFFYYFIFKQGMQGGHKSRWPPYGRHIWFIDGEMDLRGGVSLWGGLWMSLSICCAIQTITIILIFRPVHAHCYTLVIVNLFYSIIFYKYLKIPFHHLTRSENTTWNWFKVPQTCFKSNFLK